jgi:Asp-tRNA(Asn)/Glu-tRNA(Gln) amidotransferase A subunit family amidase
MDPADESATLVPDDAQEREVRLRYGAWALAGLSVVDELADQGSGGDTAEPARGPRPGDVRRSAALREVSPSPAAIELARRQGWLVTAASGCRGAQGSLAGLAVAVKDVIDVQGLPTANGAPGLPARDPLVSAAAWSALEREGAWCVGKAATHELAWGVTTPAIANPVDGSRYAGGSSGGSAAAVASGAAGAGLGTDTGGSIRIPAALCGVVGIRPTMGRTDMSGITALAPEQDVVGPLATDVATALALLEVLLGRACTPASSDVDGLRVGHLARPGRMDGAVSAAYDASLATLRRAGATLVPVDTPLLRQAGSLSLLTMLTSSARRHAEDVRSRPGSYGSSTRALLTLGEGLVSPARLAQARSGLVCRTGELFDGVGLDAFVTPTTPCVAPGRGEDSVSLGGRTEVVDAALTRYTAWSSAAGLPSIAVPTGRLPLPTSLQVIARPDREDLCARIALFIEAHRPARKRET